MTNPERPLLAVDILDEPGRSFRLIPSELPGFADNMLISNMDFDESISGTTIEVSFGQRWMNDTNRLSQSDIAMMKWDEPESG